MAGTTVIDQLIVKLGLDARDFTKGEKLVAAEALKTEQSVKRSGEGMGRSLTGMAAKWLTVAAAIAAVKKVVSIIDEVAQRTRQLGLDSRNYDIAANQLRNFENAVEMMGGSAEDARKSVANFNKSIFDLAYNGQVSDGLMLLQRLGVQFQTAGGDARDFQSVVLDTADAIAQAQAQGMSRGNAFQYLQQAGFDQGTANLILSGRANAETELRAQEQRRQVSAQDISKATDIRRASIGKDQAVEGAKIGGMALAGGIQEGVNNFISKLAGGDASGALDTLTKGATSAGTALESWALKAAGTTRGLRNNNPGNLRAVGNQPRDREGFRVFGTMEEGVQAAEAQLGRYAARGIDTIAKIANTWAPAGDKNDVGAYVKSVAGQTGIDPNARLQPSQYHAVMAAMFKHESGMGAPTEAAIDGALGARTDDSIVDRLTGGGASPTPGVQGGAGSVTKVEIDTINVQTQAKDANQMAADMDAAVQRKLMASHAEAGMQ